jgi:hypothetical protein
MADEKNNKSVTESVLGDMFGLSVDKQPAPELPKDQLVLEVLEDRTRLMVQGILYLLLTFAALALTFFFWVYANVSGNILGLVGVIAGLTITWFASQAMGKRFGRFASGIHVIDFGQKNVCIFVKSDKRKALVVPYTKIKSYKLIRQGKALRLLLEGAWVSHPSGFEFVDINRPFMSSTLDQIQEQIEQLMAQHKVKETR